MGRANDANEGDTGSDAFVYVNHCDIDADLSDARLVFAQAGNGGSEPNIKARLVTSPTHLRRFRDAITDACREHERQFLGAAAIADAEDRD